MTMVNELCVFLLKMGWNFNSECLAKEVDLCTPMHTMYFGQ